MRRAATVAGSLAVLVAVLAGCGTSSKAIAAPNTTSTTTAASATSTTVAIPVTTSVAPATTADPMAAPVAALENFETSFETSLAAAPPQTSAGAVSAYLPLFEAANQDAALLDGVTWPKTRTTVTGAVVSPDLNAQKLETDLEALPGSLSPLVVSLNVFTIGLDDSVLSIDLGISGTPTLFTLPS